MLYIFYLRRLQLRPPLRSRLHLRQRPRPCLRPRLRQRLDLRPRPRLRPSSNSGNNDAPSSIVNPGRRNETQGCDNRNRTLARRGSTGTGLPISVRVPYRHDNPYHRSSGLRDSAGEKSRQVDHPIGRNDDGVWICLVVDAQRNVSNSATSRFVAGRRSLVGLPTAMRLTR